MALTKKEEDKLDKIHKYLHYISLELHSVGEFLEENEICRASKLLGYLERDNEYYIKQLDNFED